MGFLLTEAKQLINFREKAAQFNRFCCRGAFSYSGVVAVKFVWDGILLNLSRLLNTPQSAVGVPNRAHPHIGDILARIIGPNGQATAMRGLDRKDTFRIRRRVQAKQLVPYF